MKRNTGAGFIAAICMFTGTQAIAQQRWSLLQCLDYAAAHNGELAAEVQKAGAVESGREVCLSRADPRS